jgi:hypothetical protein
MYSTCLFCRQSLGANTSVEHFPVGRRLAYDAARGRLWVVCRKCERWNLSPLEERWEAIEECERLFRGTRLRTATDQIGLARVGDGLELVRIGRPLRPEFAAWRYGDQFGRRRRSGLLRAGLGLGVVAAAVVGTNILAPAMVVLTGGLFSSAWIGIRGNPRDLVTTVTREGAAPVDIRRHHFEFLRVARTDDETGWGLEIDPHRSLVDRDGVRLRSRLELTGGEARRVAAAALPMINQFGATRRDVADAVRLIESVPTPSDLHAITRVALDLDAQPLLKVMDRPVRVAMEMAAHEEIERRAMEGELAVLEQAWRDADAIAAIADAL